MPGPSPELSGVAHLRKETMTTTLRHRKLLVALTGAAVIAGSAACGTSATAPQPTSTRATATTSASASAGPTASPAPPPSAQSACTDIGGTGEADQTCHVQSTSSSYKLESGVPRRYPDHPALP